MSLIFKDKAFISKEQLRGLVQANYHPGPYAAILMIHILVQHKILFEVALQIVGHRQIFYTYKNPLTNDFEIHLVLFKLDINH